MNESSDAPDTCAADSKQRSFDLLRQVTTFMLDVRKSCGIDSLVEVARALEHTEGNGAKQSREWLEVFVDAYEHVFASPLDAARVESITLNPQSRVLDFGGGIGAYAFALASKGHAVTVVDINQWKSRFVMWAAARSGLNHLIDDCEHGQYDAALCINVLDHSRHPSEVVRHLAGRLKPNGVLYLWADFSADTFHSSGEEVVRDVYRALTEHFIAIQHDVVHTARLQVLKKCEAQDSRHRRVQTLDGLKSTDIECLYPKRVQPLYCVYDGSSVTSSSPLFYVDTIRFPCDSVGFLAESSGAKTVREVACACGLSLESVLPMLREVWARRQIDLFQVAQVPASPLAIPSWD